MSWGHRFLRAILFSRRSNINARTFIRWNSWQFVSLLFSENKILEIVENRKIYFFSHKNVWKISTNQQHIPTDSNELYFGTENNKRWWRRLLSQKRVLPDGANALLVFLRENAHGCNRRQRSTKPRSKLRVIFRYNTAVKAPHIVEREEIKNSKYRWISSVKTTNMKLMKVEQFAWSGM